MGTKMLTTEEDLKLAEIHSKEDERMFGHLEDGEIDGRRVDDVEYCQSMAKRYLWPSWQRLQASCRRVMNQKAKKSSWRRWLASISWWGPGIG